MVISVLEWILRASDVNLALSRTHGDFVFRHIQSRAAGNILILTFSTPWQAK